MIVRVRPPRSEFSLDRIRCPSQKSSRRCASRVCSPEGGLVVRGPVGVKLWTWEEPKVGSVSQPITNFYSQYTTDFYSTVVKTHGKS